MQNVDTNTNRKLYAEINDIATDLFNYGELNVAIDLYKKALNLVSVGSTECSFQNYKKNEEVAALKIISGKEKLQHLSTSPVQPKPRSKLSLCEQTQCPTATPCKSNLYVQFEALKIESVITREHEDETMSLHHDSIKSSRVLISYNLGLSYLKQGLFDHAKALFETSVETIRYTYNQENPRGLSHVIMLLYNNLACVQYKQSKTEEAIEYLHLALQIGREAFELLFSDRTANHDVKNDLLKYIGSICSNLGMIYFMKDDYKEALSYYSEALETKRAIYEDNHIEVLSDVCNLAIIYYRNGEMINAVECMQLFADNMVSRSDDNYDEVYSKDVVSILIHFLPLFCAPVFHDGESELSKYKQLAKRVSDTRCMFGHNHLGLPVLLGQMGDILHERVSPSFAVHFYIEQLCVEEVYFGCKHPELASTLVCVGKAYVELNNHDKALKYYQRGLEIIMNTNENRRTLYHSIHAIILYSISKIHLCMNPCDGTMQELEKHLVLWEENIGKNHPDYASMKYNIGVAQLECGMVNKAVQSLQEALHIRKLFFGANHHLVVELQLCLAKIYDDQGKYDQALNVYSEILSAKQNFIGKNQPDVALVQCNIGRIHHVRGDLYKALDMYCKALKAYQHFNANQYEIIMTIRIISRIFLEMGMVDRAIEISREAAKFEYVNELVNTKECKNVGYCELIGMADASDALSFPSCASAA